MAVTICSCFQDDVIIPIVDENDNYLPLELQMNTESITKAIIKEKQLPSGSSVGLTVTDPYGVYTGEGYANVQYTASGSGTAQIWNCSSPIMLSAQSGTLYSYYPYSEAYDDITAIPIRANSTVQVDCMYGLPVSVSKDSRKAAITLKHALAAVRITYVRGTYTGEGSVSKVSFGGNCIATAGYLDATDGTLYSLSGKGSSISPAISSRTLSSTLQESEMIVIPTGENQGKVVITIDGVDYTLEFNDIQLRQGEMTQFHLTVNDGELKLSDVTVSEWTYGDSKDTEILVSDKVTITGDIDDIAFYNSVSNGTVTIVAVPKTKSILEEVEPVTYTGTCSLTQSSDIETGVRTITISNIKSDVVVDFKGTFTYDLAVEWDVKGGEATQMLYTYFFESDWEDILRIREGDKDISPSFKTTFSSSGKHIYKYSFANHTIPYSIFENCPALTKVTISDIVTTIGGYAFAKTSLTHFELPETVTSYGSAVLYDCTKLRTVILPDSLTENYDSMFRGCESLTTIKIPDSVTRFGDFAFDGCTSLALIIIPKGVTYVGNYCFSDCSNLRHIVAWPKVTPNLGGNYRYNFSGVAR